MFITAIDLGTGRIKGVIADLKKDGSLYVVKTFKKKSAGMKRGEIAYPQETVAPLFSILKEIKHFDKRCLHNLVFSISSTKSKFHISRGTVTIQNSDHVITQEDVDRVVRESMAVNVPAIWKVIHSFPREYFVDDIEVGEHGVVGLSGRRLEANVVLISIFASVRQGFKRMIEMVLGKKKEFNGSFIFAPLGSERAVLSNKQKELGVACVDIGAQTTGLVVYQDGKIIMVKVLPVGSAHITNDVAIGLKCSVEAAEKIKIEFGAASSRGISIKETVDLSHFEEEQEGLVSRKYIAEIIEVRVKELCEMIGQELTALSLVNNLPAGIVLTGGGSKMAGMVDVMRQELRLPAHIGVPTMDRFEASNGQLTQQLDDPEMSVAVGMVLHRVDALRKKDGFDGILDGPTIHESWIKRVIKTFMAID